VLVQVKNKRERLLPVRPPGVEKTSRLGSRDPVASGVKCGPHGGKNNNEVMDGFLVEPKNQGRAGITWELSHEWWLAEATSSSRGFRWFTRKPLVPWLIDKAKTKELKTEVRQHWTSLTGVWRRSPETLKWRTHVRIARLASRLSKFAVVGHPSDGAKIKTSEFALEGHVSLVS
jgi:hypothetical protein